MFNCLTVLAVVVAAALKAHQSAKEVRAHPRAAEAARHDIRSEGSGQKSRRCSGAPETPALSTCPSSHSTSFPLGF